MSSDLEISVCVSLVVQVLSNSLPKSSSSHAHNSAMDNVTLFRKIFNDNNRILNAYHHYLDVYATLPKLACNKEDLKRLNFEKESLKHKAEMLCLCEPIEPVLAKDAYNCFKQYENDTDVLEKCKKQSDDLSRVVHGVFNQLRNDTNRASHISTACNGPLNKFLDGASADTNAEFHSCFMPLYCADQLKEALTCVNNKNGELNGCENEIDGMMRCSIDSWTQHMVRLANRFVKAENNQ